MCLPTQIRLAHKGDFENTNHGEKEKLLRLALVSKTQVLGLQFFCVWIVKAGSVSNTEIVYSNLCCALVCYVVDLNEPALAEQWSSHCRISVQTARLSPKGFLPC